MRSLEALALIAVSAIVPWPAFADGAAPGSTGPTVGVTGLPADQDTTIQIRKGDRHGGLEPDFKIVTDSEEISGEPLAGAKESYDSWKKACAEWKKDMKDMNGGLLLSLNCGTPHATKDGSSRVTQTSLGTFKMKVRMRDAEGDAK